MTTLYKPVPITSAEQAEALPIGTLARDAEHYAAAKADVDAWARTDVADGLPVISDASMIGWSALVAIEAEVETQPVDWIDAYYPNTPERMQTRLVTPWQEA